MYAVIELLDSSITNINSIKRKICNQKTLCMVIDEHSCVILEHDVEKVKSLLASLNINEIIKVDIFSNKLEQTFYFQTFKKTNEVSNLLWCLDSKKNFGV